VDGAYTSETVEFRVEPPDTFVIRMKGTFTRGDVAALFPAVKRFAAARPWFVSLVDVRELDGMTSEGRQTGIQESVLPNLRGTAVIGASFPVRMLFSLGHTASNLLSRRRSSPIRFFADEAAARAWLDARRRELRAEFAVTR
jgi:hypothetical protein